MAETEPLGERMARAETLLEGIREDVTEIRAQMDALTLQRTTADAYTRVGIWVLSFVERALFMLGGAALVTLVQQHFHFPSGH